MYIFLGVLAPFVGFNTVNGRYCCNEKKVDPELLKAGFNTVNGRYCCNAYRMVVSAYIVCFNTVNGRYCCNGAAGDSVCSSVWFQYRKR